MNTAKKSYKNYKEIPVWHKIHSYTLSVYKTTTAFPRSELYCLTAQLRRSAVSIGSNVAEGVSRSSRKELIQFLCIARGSLVESEYQLLLAKDLGCLEKGTYDKMFVLYSQIHRDLNAWIKTLRNS